MARKTAHWTFTDATERDTFGTAQGVTQGDLCILESDNSLHRFTGGGPPWVAVSTGGGGGSGGFGTLDTTDSPIFLCNLDGDLLDSSGNGNDLSLLGGTTAESFVTAKGRQWYPFRGQTVLTAAAAPSLAALGDCTCVTLLWLNKAITATQNLWGRFFAGSSAGTFNANYFTYLNASSLTVNHQYGSGTGQNMPLSNPSTSQIGLAPVVYVWRRDVGTNEIDHFIFDTLVETDTFTNDPSSGADAPIYVGGQDTAVQRLDGCYLGTIAAYDSKLTQAQITNKIQQLVL